MFTTSTAAILASLTPLVVLLPLAGCGSSAQTHTDPTRELLAHAKVPPHTSPRLWARRKRELSRFIANRQHETRLVAEVPGGVREVVYVSASNGGVCIGIQASVPGTPLAETPQGSDTCGTAQQQKDVFVVTGAGAAGGNILNIAGYSNCGQTVVLDLRVREGHVCVAQPFPFRLVVLPLVSTVKLHNAGWLHTIRPKSFRCSPNSGTCFVDIMPNGAAHNP